MTTWRNGSYLNVHCFSPFLTICTAPAGTVSFTALAPVLKGCLGRGKHSIKIGLMSHFTQWIKSGQHKCILSWLNLYQEAFPSHSSETLLYHILFSTAPVTALSIHGLPYSRVTRQQRLQTGSLIPKLKLLTGPYTSDRKSWGDLLLFCSFKELSRIERPQAQALGRP